MLRRNISSHSNGHSNSYGNAPSAFPAQGCGCERGYGERYRYGNSDDIVTVVAILIATAIITVIAIVIAMVFAAFLPWRLSQAESAGDDAAQNFSCAALNGQLRRNQSCVAH